MRLSRNHILILLAVGALLGCAKVGDVPRLEKSTASTSDIQIGKSADSSNETAVPQVYWLDATRGALPDGVIPMGTMDGQTSYVCRATVGSALLLGPVTANGSCVLPSNGWFLFGYV